MQTLMRGLERYHYSPQDIDDNFSERVFDRALEMMDGGKRFLTLEEVNELQVYRTQLDDEAQAGTYAFFRPGD